MTERERLIVLVKDIAEDMVAVCGDSCDDCKHGDCVGKLADHLLSNGVIVLPCKAGDMLYDIYDAVSNGGDEIRELKVPEIHINLDRRNRLWLIISGYFFAFEDFGKTVFLTKEEAEKALKERQKK